MKRKKEDKLFYGIIGGVVLFVIVLVIYLLEWWEILALGFLKVGLGLKVAGAKTFSAALIKIGGKKALAISTSGVLMKRHIIDLATRFFTEHSVSRYKDSATKLTKMKILEIKELPLIKKVKAISSTLLSVPIVYIIWTKIITGAIQKMLYVFIYPVIKGLFFLASIGLGFFANFVEFIVQVLFLNLLLEKLQKYKVGKYFVDGLFFVIALIAEFFDGINQLGKYFGIDLKHELIVMSLRFNRYLESLIYKKSNAIHRLSGTREIHKTSREKLIIERDLRKKKKSEKEKKFGKKFKDFSRVYVLKRLTWKEKRAKRLKKSKILKKKFNISTEKE